MWPAIRQVPSLLKCDAAPKDLRSKQGPRQIRKSARIRSTRVSVPAIARAARLRREDSARGLVAGRSLRLATPLSAIALTFVKPAPHELELNFKDGPFRYSLKVFHIL